MTRLTAGRQAETLTSGNEYLRPGYPPVFGLGSLIGQAWVQKKTAQAPAFS